MPNYFARVELHDGDDDDYDSLHIAMKKKGFTNCLKYTKGGSNKLPTGFYYGKLVETKTENVLRQVKRAAATTGLSNEITVVKSAGSSSALSQPCN